LIVKFNKLQGRNEFPNKEEIYSNSSNISQTKSKKKDNQES
jgi:hypothetical protein